MICRGGRSGGRAAKATDLTSGGLGCVSELLMTCRKRIRRCQNRGVAFLRDQFGDVLRLPKRHPAWRRREAQSGSCTERENLAAGVIFLEPCFRGVGVCQHLEMTGVVANMMSGIDINPNGCHWSILSFRRPLCVSLRDESNSRSTCRLSALSIPMRACITKSRPSAAPINQPRFAIPRDPVQPSAAS